MSADEVVTIYEWYEERDDLPIKEIEVRVECWIDPGQDGATDSYGVPLEPSWGPCVEDIEPIEARFVGSNWHDYDYFMEKWDLSIELDYDELFKNCVEKNEAIIDYDTISI